MDSERIKAKWLAWLTQGTISAMDTLGDCVFLEGHRGQPVQIFEAGGDLHEIWLQKSDVPRSREDLWREIHCCQLNLALVTNQQNINMTAEQNRQLMRWKVQFSGEETIDRWLKGLNLKLPCSVQSKLITG